MKKKVGDIREVKEKGRNLWRNGVKKNGALGNNMKKVAKLLR
jgi:hypothetical protein